jgi:carboxyl-terminal processing protease
MLHFLHNLPNSGLLPIQRLKLKMNIKYILISLLILVWSMATSFFMGYFMYPDLHPPELNYPILAESRRIFLENALYDIPPDPALEYGMIRGMLQAYNDPYSIFVEPPQHELETDSFEGSYGGIGARMVRDSENYILLYPFPDGPAARAGLVDGDRLVLVDDLEITPETTMEIAQASIRGPEGEMVVIGVARPPDHTHFEFEIERENIALPSVTWRIASEDARIGVVEINLIAASTPDEIKEAVSDLTNQGATHFVLDLRNNGGGLLDSGVDIAQLFLHEGTIIEQQHKNAPVDEFKAYFKGSLADIPILIFVNEGTASASEIIAGALQVHGRAKLIGTPTYGKDSIQLIFDLQDGSSLHVTSARWWIPGLELRSEEFRLHPDIPIPPEPQDTDPYISSAIEHWFGNQ